jgi:uncharacterized delta-60 repeat protein
MIKVINPPRTHLYKLLILSIFAVAGAGLVLQPRIAGGQTESASQGSRSGPILVRGVVSAGGSPVEGAVVELLGRQGMSSRTSADGKYTIQVPSAGAYIFSIRKSGYVFPAASRTFRIDRAGRSNLDFSGLPVLAENSLPDSPQSGGTAPATVRTNFTGNFDDVGHGAVVQPDGKIIVAGYSFNGANDDFAVARYDANGTLDTTGFNPSAAGGAAAGTVRTNFLNSGDDAAFAVRLQPDGRIVVAGYSFNGTSYDFALARYNTDGSLDTAGFNSAAAGGTAAGTVRTNFTGSRDDVAYSIALQSDGKIVAAGYAFNGANEDFALARYNADGSLDTGFNAGGGAAAGTVRTNFVGNNVDIANAVAIQADGKIVAAGFSLNGADEDFALARYNSDGSLDTAGFNPPGNAAAGTVRTNFSAGSSDIAYSAVIQPDGKIVAAGDTYLGSNDDFALARYNADGSLDAAGFNASAVNSPAGTIRTNFPAGLDDAAFALALQTDGKIVAAGGSFNGTNDDFALARYNPNGSLDAAGFNASGALPGTIQTNFAGSRDDAAFALSLQTDGKIAAAGHSYNGTNEDFAVARYKADGTPDTAGFNASGLGISGNIAYGTPAASGSKFVTRVTLTAAGSSSASTISDLSGAYLLSGLGTGPFTVTPSKTGDVNGIQSGDATLVLRHVASGGNLLTANQQIAADANNSGTVTSGDATQILRYVAANGQTASSGITGAWKFVPASKSYSSLAGDLAGENYTAILVGEVSGNWTAPASIAGGLERSDRTEPNAESAQAAPQADTGRRARSGSLRLTFGPAEAKAGSIVTIPVIINNAGAGISAYSFAVRFDPNILRPIEPAADAAATLSSEFLLAADANQPGRIGIAAASAGGEIEGEGILVNLRFKLIGKPDAATFLRFDSTTFEDDRGFSNYKIQASGRELKLR